MRKKATRKRPYFDIAWCFWKTHHGILFARRLICLKNWKTETFSKITIKVSKGFFFFEKTAKKWNAAPRHIVAGLKPLNFTIFKALEKKGGWRKQVHLWQVSKASQLKCYLVKILQDNAFFTRLKIARRFLSSALS